MEYENHKRGAKNDKDLKEKEITSGQANRKGLIEEMACEIALEGRARTWSSEVWHSRGNKGREVAKHRACSVTVNKSVQQEPSKGAGENIKIGKV